MSKTKPNIAGSLAEVTGTPENQQIGKLIPKKKLSIYLMLIPIIISAIFVWEYSHIHLPAFAQEHFLIFAIGGGLAVGSLVTGIFYSLLRIKTKNVTLKDRTDFYEALLHAQSDLGEGLIILEEDRIVYANNACYDITGYTSQELAAMPSFLLVVVPQQRKLLAERLQKRMKGIDVEEQYETAIHHKNGMTVELEISIKKFYMKDTVRLAVIARDISERKKIENTKSEFVSWVSHQLRTPLTASNYLAEMLLGGDMGKMAKEQMHSIQKIYDANQRMIGLINALLDVARIELGTIVIECSPTKISDVCNSVLDDLNPEIKSKRLKIERTYSKDIPLINIDPKLLRMVFQNLLSNAVKYTSKGKISVKTQIEAGHVLISIQDTGMGIPKKNQENIFEKLFRAENVLGKDIEGTGLGLYIIKAVVEMCAGTIRFESKEGVGTTFFVSLPLSQDSCAHKEPDFL